MIIYPVILCGGAGTRLWPASRAGRAKQFLALVGERSSFENTLARLEGVVGAAPAIIVTGESHVEAVERQLGGRSATILVEPEARDSGPAIAAAMAWIAARDAQGVAVILAADHHVADTEGFRAAVATAVEGARNGHIVTLGVTPTAASTAYGYIQPGEAVGEGGLRRLARFTEKPDAEAAQALTQAGWLWNSGTFVAGAATMIGELERHAPDVLAAARTAVEEAQTKGQIVGLGEAFRQAPRISIDYAVMEKTERAVVLPVAFGWSDLGAWDAVWDASTKDGSGNALSGEAILENASDCLIRAEPGRLVAAVGVKGLAVIVEDDAVLVCDLAASQGVKAVAARASARGSGRAEDDALAAQADWFSRWLRINALSAWWTLGADRKGGGFFEALDQDGRPLDLPRRSRVQTRQTFVYARAGALGWAGPWREALAHGRDFLTRCFVRPDGLHRTLVAASGAPVDETAVLYDQAFALLALAAEGAAREDEARALMAAIEGVFRWEGGGFAEAAAPRFVSNPLMHLFEAVLAWAETGAAATWRGLAEEIGAFALERLVDSRGGFIAEVFDPSWQAVADGGQISPGHQFEWCWLMMRWHRLTASAPALAAAERLYDAGGRGVLAGGVTANAMDLELRLADRRGRLWPQTERLKAALSLAALASGERRSRLEADARSAAAVLRRYLATPAAGLWFDVIDAGDRMVPGPALASSFYHLIGAVEALQTPLPLPS